VTQRSLDPLAEKLGAAVDVRWYHPQRRLERHQLFR